MKVFIACLGTETNTFSSMPTGVQTFEDTMLFRGDATRHPASTFSLPLHVWRAAAEERQGRVVESLAAFAQPAGLTVRRVYEGFRDEILDDLRAAMPVDIVLLSMHGAMTAEGYEDCEGDLLARVRGIVGPDAVVGGELDLHCSITPKMVEHADALVTFKEYPHVDGGERAAELFDICLAAHQGRAKPVMAVHDCRMVGMWRTPVEPVRGLVGDMQAAEGRDGILSVSFAHGFPWQDVPETTARVLVVADGDAALAAETARAFGQRIWELRDETGQDMVTIDEALDLIEEGPGPVVVADVADNAGGGAPSDSTFLLARALERGATGLLSGYYWDPGRRALLRGGGRRRHLAAPDRRQMRAGLRLAPGSDRDRETHNGGRFADLRRGHHGHGHGRLAFLRCGHRSHPELGAHPGLPSGRHDPAWHRSGELQGHCRQIDPAFLCRLRAHRVADRLCCLRGRHPARLRNDPL